MKMNDLTQNPDVKSAVRWATVFGVLIAVAGVLAIAVPLAAGMAVNVLVAWLLVFSGVAHLVYGFQSRGAGTILGQVLLGLLYAGIGVYLLLNPLVGLAALTLWLAGFLLLEAGVEIALFFHLRKIGGVGWLLLDGIATLALAIMVGASWPSSSEWAIGTLVGISMVFSGLARATLAQALKSAAGGH
jgi:uncharacterized membrane protein HdeD (DUF308 family)